MLGADGAGRVTVRMGAQKGAAFGDHRATLRLSGGSVEVAHAVVYTFIR